MADNPGVEFTALHNETIRLVKDMPFDVDAAIAHRRALLDFISRAREARLDLLCEAADTDQRDLGVLVTIAIRD